MKKSMLILSSLLCSLHAPRMSFEDEQELFADLDKKFNPPLPSFNDNMPLTEEEKYQLRNLNGKQKRKYTKKLKEKYKK
jgi:hypothetical protein